MRIFNLTALFLFLLVAVSSCTTGTEDDEIARPDYSNLITGTYAYTTTIGGSTTGSGTAIITKETNNKIQIVLQDKVSFYATQLERIDNDLVMEVPQQAVDYYGMDAQFTGNSDISREGSRYDGVFFGNEGQLLMSLSITVNNDTDKVLLTLNR